MKCGWFGVVMVFLLVLAGPVLAETGKINASSTPRPAWMFSGELPSGRSGLLGMGESLQSAVLDALAQLQMDKELVSPVEGVENQLRKVKVGNDLLLQQQVLYDTESTASSSTTTLVYRGEECKYIVSEEVEAMAANFSQTLSVTASGGDTCNFAQLMNYLAAAGIDTCAQAQDENGNVHVLLCLDGKVK